MKEGEGRRKFFSRCLIAGSVRPAAALTCVREKLWCVRAGAGGSSIPASYLNLEMREKGKSVEKQFFQAKV